jgi:hypothetical protein
MTGSKLTDLSDKDLTYYLNLKNKILNFLLTGENKPDQREIDSAMFVHCLVVAAEAFIKIKAKAEKLRAEDREEKEERLNTRLTAEYKHRHLQDDDVYDEEDDFKKKMAEVAVDETNIMDPAALLKTHVKFEQFSEVEDRANQLIGQIKHAHPTTSRSPQLRLDPNAKLQR